MESSGGHNDNCKLSGRYNGYGFAQNRYQWVCYISMSEVQTKVESWLENEANKGLTLPQLLCLYNRGIIENDCPYYEHYLELK